jgi:hypothetical protein
MAIITGEEYPAMSDHSLSHRSAEGFRDALLPVRGPENDPPVHVVSDQAAVGQRAGAQGSVRMGGRRESVVARLTLLAPEQNPAVIANRGETVVEDDKVTNRA